MITVTFTYAPGELGPQPEDVSVHKMWDKQAAANLVSYNLSNKGLVSITVEFDNEGE